MTEEIEVIQSKINTLQLEMENPDISKRSLMNFIKQ